MYLLYLLRSCFIFLLPSQYLFFCRLSGAALVVPVVNFWWPSVPTSLYKETLGSLPFQDQMAMRVAHYTPWLYNWWLTQKWFPSFSILQPNSPLFSDSDNEAFKNLLSIINLDKVYLVLLWSYHKVFNVLFRNWKLYAIPGLTSISSLHLWTFQETLIHIFF